jgi:6-phospho-beta-glucosidase
MAAWTSLAEVVDTVEVDYLGLNHLGWLRGLCYRDGDRQVDVMAKLLATPHLLERLEEGRLFGSDVICALDAIPNEYLYWYYAQREALRDVRAAGRTRGEHVRREQQAFYAAAAADPSRAAQLWRQANDERNRSYLAELRNGERDEADVGAGGYESVAVALALAAALTGGRPARLILNVANGPTIPGLPPDATVETVCRVDTSGALALPVRPPTLHQLGLMASVKASEQAIIAAARSRSSRAALRAFATHPLVASLQAARTLSTLFTAEDR